MEQRLERHRSGNSLSFIIPDMIAELEQTPPAQLSPPVYEIIPTDKLDDLVREAGDDTDIHIEFQYGKYEVQIKNHVVTVKERHRHRVT